VLLEAAVEPPTWSPAATMAVAAALSVWPTTFGTATDFDAWELSPPPQAATKVNTESRTRILPGKVLMSALLRRVARSVELARSSAGAQAREAERVTGTTI
jgi:hypothetical protein